MINADILAIKENILKTVGDDCEKIILFGSHAKGTSNKNSDYDFYVILKDGSKNPLLVLQQIYEFMCDTHFTPVDVLANYKSKFDWLATQPTLQKAIAKEGVVLYER